MLLNNTIQIAVTKEQKINAILPQKLLCEIADAFYYEEIFGVRHCDIKISINSQEILIKTTKETIRCTQQNWLFLLITTIEDIVIEKYGKCIFHGSAIAKKGRGVIAFIGESGSGKTTIASKIIQTNPQKYFLVSDDLLIYNKFDVESVWLPTKEKTKKSKLITYTNENQIRFIHKVRRDFAKNLTLPLVAIVNVKYQNGANNSFELLRPSQRISVLLKNSRKSPNNKFLIDTIVDLANNVPIYKLVYGNNDFALDEIKQLLI